MTLFGKVLLGLILATAGFLIIKGAGGTGDEALLVPQEESITSESSEPVTQSGVFTGSTKDLMARGGNYKCTFAQEVENSKSTGTVYISGQKLRGDFKSDVTAAGASMSVESYMISDGTSMWTWSSMLPTGFKMEVVKDTTADGTTPMSQQMFDANMNLSYDCAPWTVDESKFVLPSTVTFTTI